MRYILLQCVWLSGARPVAEYPNEYYGNTVHPSPLKRFEDVWNIPRTFFPERLDTDQFPARLPTIRSVENFTGVRAFTFNGMPAFDNKTKLDRLRAELEAFKLNAYVVPTTDAHDSEYPVPADARRQYISGFTGSAGTAVVELDKANLWTDGRYFLQADRQLDSSLWTLKRSGTPGCPTISEYLKSRGNELGESKQFRVGFDPYVHTLDWLKSMKRDLDGTNIKMVPVHKGTEVSNPESEDLEIMRGLEQGQDNLVDRVWNADGTRPKYPNAPVVLMKDEITGESVQSKLTRIREVMKTKEMGSMIIAALSDTAWIFNLRGLDAPYSRIFLSYGIITQDKAILYLNVLDRLEKEARKALEQTGVTIKDYSAIAKDMPNVIKEAQKGVWIDSSVNVALNRLAKQSVAVSGQALQKQNSEYLEENIPAKEFRGIKNPVELSGMIDAHLEDASAVIAYLAWLDSMCPSVLKTFTESTASDKLDYFRSIQPSYVALSFPSISGMDDNGAVIHYRAEPETAKALNPNGMYLIDSGAHYMGGTTDITRTVHFGTPTPWQKELYTRVLIGHVEIAMTVFTNKTRGYMFDFLARRPLLEIGLDYLHGTGHGVGHSLEVHESPPTISSRAIPNQTDGLMLEGMVVSDEPGVYLDGEFGIRIENLIYAMKAYTPHRFNGVDYLRFGQLTRVPYCRKLIDVSLMSPKQVAWVNEYHQEVLKLSTPYLMNMKIDNNLKEYARRWLRDACAPL